MRIVSLAKYICICMGKYSDYNIIPIGDHCAISMILSDLTLRKQSYPFDWVSNKDQLHDTNILYNTEIIEELKSSDNINNIVKKNILVTRLIIKD